MSRLDDPAALDEGQGRRPLGNDDRRQLARQLLIQQLGRLDAERMAAGEQPLAAEDVRALSTAVLNRLFGLGRLQGYIDDPQWTDIHANGCDGCG
ncbi:MAG: hypothetical protein R2755_26075 [Acidimicrobiales bacterium]